MTGMKRGLALVIGIDFDNTIAEYDGLMFNIASEWGLIGSGVARRKQSIRDAIRQLPDGEKEWRRLQAAAYGARMREARMMEGIRSFLLCCRNLSVSVYIISHKTEYANYGEPKVNLRTAAIAWMEQHGFFDEESIGLDRNRVFFESNRADKIRRLIDLGVTHFIDDLEEVFQEASFPPEVLKLLFSPHKAGTHIDGVLQFQSWTDIQEYLLGH